MKKLALFSILALGLFSCEKNEVKVDDYQPREARTQQRSEKRGVSFKFAFEEDINILSHGISWSYNWSPSQIAGFDKAMNDNNIDFCPMGWDGINKDALSEYISRNQECEYLLAYNEPNLTDQANMTPQEAADGWDKIKAAADEFGLKIISPAMNYGTLENYHDPIVWLDEFFELVPIEDIHGISVHCYMTSPSALKSYIQRFEKYNKPIWLTEFCAWDGSVSPESQQQFMCNTLNYLESCNNVYRYAWFIPRGSGSEDKFPYMFLLKNSVDVQLTELGKIYTQMSTQDTSLYYVEQQRIEAEHYTSVCVSETANTKGWTEGPKVRITSEASDESLELYNFLPKQWVEYQIEIDRSKEFNMQLRYSSYTDAKIELYIDGELATTHALTKTGQDYIWNTANIPQNINQGKHKLRIKVTDGIPCFNWLKII